MIRRNEDKDPAVLFITTCWCAAGQQLESSRALLRGSKFVGDINAPYDERIAMKVLKTISGVMEEDGQEQLDLNSSFGLGMALLAKGDFPPFGDSALHLAARIGSGFASALLVDAGADLDTKNAKGLTPLELAHECGEGSDSYRFLKAAAAVQTREQRRTFARKWMKDEEAAEKFAKAKDAFMTEAATLM